MLSAKSRVIRRDKPLTPATPLRHLRPSADPAICSRCQAVWRKGTWSLDPAIRREVRRWRTPVPVICPACRLTEEGTPAGIFSLAGSFLPEKQAEIFQLLRNTERAVTAKNPLERIIRIEETPDHQVLVHTTGEKLARRLGKVVTRAYGGALEIHFAHDEKFVRVYWRRDVAGRTP